jgi:DNA-binding protein
LAKKDSKMDSKIFIGKKRSMDYVLAALVVLNESRSVKLLARGKTISHAVDVGEILKNNFLKGASYGEILITTEELTNKDGTNSNVSSIEIEILPPSK